MLFKVAETDDIGSGQIAAVQLDGRELAICRIGKEFFAFDGSCTHQYAPLADGWLEDYHITCPLHGARFDVRSGKVVSLPAMEDLQTYQVVIQGKDVLVRIEDLEE